MIQISIVPELAMGNGTSIGNFGSLTMTDSEGVFFDVGALSRNAGSLSRDPDSLSSNPDTLSCDPDALSFNPEALSFDPDALSFDTDALRFDADALSFEVFHQRLGSNGLISSHLR